MFKNKDEYREHLEELTYEELFGDDWMQAEAEDEIEGRLDAIREELECMPYEELFGEDYLEELAQEEIERRLEEFEEVGEQ